MPSTPPHENQNPIDALVADIHNTGFEASPDAVDALLKQLQMLKITFAKIEASQALGRASQLSDSPTAQWISDRLHESAVGTDGMITALNRARNDMVEKVVEALQQARHRYIDSDETAAQALKQGGNV